jgi:triosephosphate isomerase
MMRKPLVAGNWKMNGSVETITALTQGLSDGMAQVASAEVAVCAPAIYLPLCQSQLQDTAIAWGGQDVSVQDSGAYTGETAASMLLDYGCTYVIVGHSERRTYHGETDELVADKAHQAMGAGLIPILCVGETLEEREQEITEQVVARQMAAYLNKYGLSEKLVVAYEPVWAIGTGKTATPEQAQDVHAFIRAQMAAIDAEAAQKVRILYGGSMNPKNAAELMAKPDIDGGLVGGASLKAPDFLSVCQAG